MSKLVSKNIVQRFKTGSSIRIGDDIYKEGSDGTFSKYRGGRQQSSKTLSFKDIKKAAADFDPNLNVQKNSDGTYTTYIKLNSGIKYSPNEKKYYVGKTGYKNESDARKALAASKKETTDKRTEKKVGSTTRKATISRGKKTSEINVAPASFNVSTTPAQSVVLDNGETQYTLNNRGRLAPGANWNYGLQAALSSPYSNFLTELGLNADKNGNYNYTTEQVQEALKNYANNRGVLIQGINDDNFVDNKWGTQTQSAWNTLYNLFNTKDVTPPAPKLQTNFGYTTTNTYSDPIKTFRQRLQSLGINSNQSLINWLNNTKDRDISDAWQRQFRTDVDKALGSNYSNENIEKVFDTQGKWYRGKEGDYNDFQNALATQAGTWNGTADKLKQQYYNNLGNSAINNMMPPSGNYVPPLEIRNFAKNNSFSGTFVPTIKLKQGAKLTSKNVIERFKRSFQNEEAVTSLKTV